MLVYKIENMLNGKVYIGQTIQTLKRRISEHVSVSKKQSNLYLYNAMKKYGVDNFNYSIIDECDNRDELNELEIYYIKKYNSTNAEFGYNYASGGYGGGTKGYKHSKESKKLMSKNTKENHPFAGKTMGRVWEDRRAKWFLVKYPNGNEKYILNLKRFCKKNNIGYFQLGNMKYDNNNSKKYKNYKITKMGV